MAGAIEADYDRDPGRSRSFRLGWQEDVHGPVARRLRAEGVDVVVDVGCGIGRFAAAVSGGPAWIGVDSSPRQLSDCAQRPAVLGDALRLPFVDSSVGAVVMLWMLYHLDDPARALAEAARVVRPGGLVVLCAANRESDPELVPGGYPPTSFDAEEAEKIAAVVFARGDLEVQRWDEPMVTLADRDEGLAYCRSHLLPPEAAEGVEFPLTLTKRGCLIWARVTEGGGARERATGVEPA